MNFKEKFLFLIFIIVITLIWLTFGEWVKKKNGITLAVVTGTGVENQIRRFENVRDWIEYQNHLEALADLEDEKVDAVIMDLLPAQYKVKVNHLGEGRFKLTGKRLTYSKGRVVFNAGDDSLRHIFDRVLLELIQEGTYARIYLKYFGVQPQSNINRTINIFFKAKDDSWLKIQTKGIIEFGMVFNNPPFCFYDQENRLTGFEVELANAVCKQLGVECHMIDVEWYGAASGLTNNSYDALWAGSNDFKSLKGQVNFSMPYYYSGAQLVVRAGSPITGPESLKRSLSFFDIFFRRKIF